MKNNTITKMNKITCYTAPNLHNFFSRKLWLIGFLFLFLTHGFAQPGSMSNNTDVDGTYNNNVMTLVGLGSNNQVFTYKEIANATTSQGVKFYQFNTDSYFNTWNFNNPTYNSVQTATWCGGCGYNGNIKMNSTTSGRHYTFNIRKGISYANQSQAVLETSYSPTTINSYTTPSGIISGQTASGTITLASLLNGSEFLYVSWSTDGFASSANSGIVATTFSSGSTYNYTIPATLGGATVTFYPFTSVSSSVPTFSDAPLLTLRMRSSTGENNTDAYSSYFVSNLQFNGTTNSLWSVASNWNSGITPSTTSNLGPVIINANCTLDQNATVGSLTVNNSTTLTASDATPRTLTIASGGTITNNGTFTAGNGTVAFAGSGTVSGTVSFNNVTIAGGVNFGSASTILTSLQMNSGSFINTNPPTYASGSTLIYNTTGTYGRNLEWSATSGPGFPHHVRIQNGTIVDLSANGFDNRAIAGNLNLGLDGGSSAGSLTMGAMTNSLTIGGNLIIGGNTSGGTSVLTLSTAIGGDIYLSGNWDTKTNGSYNSNTRAVFFAGTGTSTVSTLSAATFDFLFVNKTSGGVVSLANDMTVNNNLTLNAQLVTNDFKVIIPSTSSVTANANGWVRGNLQKNIPTGTSSRTFEIGDSSVYTPVTTAYTGVSAAGNITVRTTSGDHPQIASSNITAAKSVNRFYRITNSGVAGGSYAATFTFDSQDTDLQYAASPPFDIGIFNNSSWTAATVGTRNTTSTQATGLTSYGDFQLGEKKTSSWTGNANSTVWNNAANWSFGVPTSSTEVTIPSNGNGFYPIITADGVVINTLTIDTGASLTVASGVIATSRALTVENEIVTNGTLTIENNAGLIQKNNVTNTGSIVVKRNSSLLKRLDYTLWSSPVASQNLFGFSPLTLTNRFYTYNQTANGYTATDMYTSGLLSISSTFQNGRGYLIRMPDNHPTTATTWEGQFTGVPNNGTILVPLSTAGGGITLVGNPYPSPIKVDAFLNDNLSRINPTLWFWRKTNGATGSAYVALTAGLASGGNSVLATASESNDRFIQPGQGFFVKAKAAGNLQFTNQQRFGNVDVFYRTNVVSSSPAVARLWLHLKSNDVVVGAMAIGYREGATNQLDTDYDGLYINDNPLALTSFVQGEELSVQHRAVPFLNTDIVPLSFKTDVAGNYTIAINAFDGLFSDGDGQDIYLRDNVTGAIQNLKTESYSFSTDAGVFTSRFEIVYQSVLSVSAPIFSANQVFVYKNEANDFVINAGNTVISGIKVFDISGRLLYNSKEINATQTSIDVGPTNQALLLQITSKDGEVVTKKIIR